MKRFILILSVLHFLCTTAFLLNAQDTNKTYAIIVGISRYQNLPSLRNADKDAQAYYDFLLSPEGEIKDGNNVKLFLNEDATSFNIVSAMEYLMENVKENDKVIFYFAGHGDVENRTSFKMPYLLCCTSPKTCYPAGGCLDMNYLQSFAKTLIEKKNTVILILDACRAGKLLTGGEEGKQSFSIAVNEWKGITKILSCQPGESSYEYDNLGNGGSGVFTYHLIRGLQGLADYNKDGNISIEEIGDYLRDSVKNTTKSERKIQRPVVCCDLDKIISHVNEVVNLKYFEKEISNEESFESKQGFQPEVNSYDLFMEYEKFNSLIKNNKLVYFDSTDSKENNAYFIYQKLKDNTKAKSIIRSMRNALIASVMNHAQIFLNYWLKSTSPPDSIKPDRTYLELKAANDIIDPNDNMYKQVKSTYLMWNYDRFKGSLTDKEQMIRECISLDPNNPMFYFDLAFLESDPNINEIDSSISNYNIVLNYAPNFEGALNNIASSYEAIDRDEEAIAAYDKVIDISASKTHAYSKKGKILIKQNKLDEALKCFDIVIESEPKNPYPMIDKGFILLLRGDKGSAESHFKKAIDINTKNHMLITSIGINYYKMMDYTKALTYFDRALNIKPNYSSALIQQAITLAQLGKDKEAVSMAEQALKIDPESVNILYNCACVYSILKDKKKMLSFLKRAVEKGKKPYQLQAGKDEDFREYFNDNDFITLIRR